MCILDKIKIKPQLMLGVTALLAIAITSLVLEQVEVAMACAVGIVAAVKLLADADNS